MKKMLTLAGVSVMALSLGTGVASASHNSSGDIHGTGPKSENVIDIEKELDLRFRNNNDVNLQNDTEQNGRSGDAVVRYNTLSGGGVRTGSVTNDNFTDAEVEIENDSSANLGGFGGNGGGFDGSIELTGPESENRVEYNRDVDVRVQNDNNVKIDNNTEQNAVSGDAVVRGNTSAGGARTGDVENINTSSLRVRIEN